MATRSTIEELERREAMALVQAAIRKQAGGQKLSPAERSAWKRWEEQQDRERGLRFARRVPKAIYREWSGRQTKILHEQADAFGFPLRGATIDVPAVVRAVHDWLAEHKHELAAIRKNAAAGGGQSLKEQLLAEQIDLYRGKNQLLERQLAELDRVKLDRSEVHALLVRAATMLRAAGERLYKQCGQQAGDILATTLKDFEQTIVAELADAKRPADDATLEA